MIHISGLTKSVSSKNYAVRNLGYDLLPIYLNITLNYVALAVKKRETFIDYNDHFTSVVKFELSNFF